jgi:hypothetical protein
MMILLRSASPDRASWKGGSRGVAGGRGVDAAGLTIWSRWDLPESLGREPVDSWVHFDPPVALSLSASGHGGVCLLTL